MNFPKLNNFPMSRGGGKVTSLQPILHLIILITSIDNLGHGGK